MSASCELTDSEEDARCLFCSEAPWPYTCRKRCVEEKSSLNAISHEHFHLIKNRPLTPSSANDSKSQHLVLVMSDVGLVCFNTSFPSLRRSRLLRPLRGGFIYACSSSRHQPPTTPTTTPTPTPRPSRAPAKNATTGIFSTDAKTLMAVTVLWGSQHSVMKMAILSGASPDSLTALRFAVASLFLSPFLRERLRAREIAGGIELGLWSFLGFALQTFALETTTASRSAFLLYLNVKLVPFLGLLLGKPPPKAAWLAALTALCGTFVLAADGNGANNFSWVLGDSLSVASALASALFIVRLGSYAENSRAEQLSAVTISVTAVLGFIWTCFNSGSGDASGSGLVEFFTSLPAETWLASLYLGAIPTAFATVLQARAQKSVPAERAAIIYAIDPVYGAAFSHFLLGESFGSRGFIGAALIFVAAFISNSATSDGDGDTRKDGPRRPAEDLK